MSPRRSDADDLWPLTNQESLILALLVFPFLSFALGYYVALETLAR